MTPLAREHLVIYWMVRNHRDSRRGLRERVDHGPSFVESRPGGAFGHPLRYRPSAAMHGRMGLADSLAVTGLVDHG